jgi:uncharacterized membrane protein
VHLNVLKIIGADADDPTPLVRDLRATSLALHRVEGVVWVLLLFLFIIVFFFIWVIWLNLLLQASAGVPLALHLLSEYLNNYNNDL